jgi:hypothetical protein
VPVFEHGHFDGDENRGWVVGHFAPGARRTRVVEVKWAHERKGPAGIEWRNCMKATTLSVLISGRFKIEFQDAPVLSVDLKRPGDYVIFGPGIRHRSTALKNTLFLTIRWPSVKGDCREVSEKGAKPKPPAKTTARKAKRG